MGRALLLLLLTVSPACGPQPSTERESALAGMRRFTEWTTPSLDFYEGAGGQIVARAEGGELLEGEALMRRCVAVRERDPALLARQALRILVAVPEASLPVDYQSQVGPATVVVPPELSGDTLRFFVRIDREFFEYRVDLSTMALRTRPAEELVAERYAREVAGEPRCGLSEYCGCWRGRCERFTPVRPEANQQGNYRKPYQDFYTYQSCVEDCEGGTCALYCHTLVDVCTASCPDSPPSVQCVEVSGRCEMQEAPRTGLIPYE